MDVCTVARGSGQIEQWSGRAVDLYTVTKDGGHMGRWAAGAMDLRTVSDDCSQMLWISVWQMPGVKFVWPFFPISRSTMHRMLFTRPRQTVRR